MSTTKTNFNGVSSRDGLLYRNEKVVDVSEADALAASVNIAYAERIVDYLEPSNIKENCDLIHFAKRVLSILESSQDWSADTTEAICNAAINANVAHFNNGFFHANKKA